MRPKKDTYYLNIAREIAQRSTCFRAKHGAIIVKDDVILSTGYVGAPRKTRDCFERGDCLRDKLKIPHGQRYELCRSVHAEMNCFINASRAGAKLLGGDIYFWSEDRDGSPANAFPCFICKKMIINAGLNRMICSQRQGGYVIYHIADWVQEWQERDIIDDKKQYGTDLNEKDGFKE